MRYFLLLISTCLLVTLIGCPQNETVPNIRADPLPQDEYIQIYFNQNQAQGANYTDPYRNIARSGDNLEDIIINNIDSATETIALAIQEFRLPKIAQALEKKKESGVKVQVILENDYNRPWSDYSQAEINQLTERERARYEEAFRLIDMNEDGTLSQSEINQRDALVILENAGIPIIDDTADGSKGSGLMHHKFIIIDQETVIVTSANFTMSGIHGDFSNPETLGNANNLVKIDSKELASIFQEEFEIMWGDGVGGKPDSRFGLQKPEREFSELQIGDSLVAVNFSPTSPSQNWKQSSNGFIAKHLEKANNKIDLALFVFSYQNLSNSLGKLHNNGTSIRGLIDRSFAYRYYSEGLDMLGVELARDCEIAEDNNPWESPISTVGVPELPEGDNLHHKFAVVDEEIVITGSHNWSASANYRNDETVLLINNPTVAAHYDREFKRLYDRAVLGIPSWLEKKIEQQQQKCLVI
ncbi:MAG: phospholipase D-like domain-containing protein [Halothece sp.]